MTQAIIVSIKDEVLAESETTANIVGIKQEAIYNYDTPSATLVAIKQEALLTYYTPSCSITSLKNEVLFSAQTVAKIVSIKQEVLFSNESPPRKRHVVNLN